MCRVVLNEKLYSPNLHSVCIFLLPEIISNFRKVEVYPRHLEILGQEKFFIPKNITKGQFASPEHYLQIQFLLLREDFVASVREGIKSYLSKLSTTAIDVYENVKTVEGVNKFGKKHTKILHDSFNKIVQNDESKKLMTGSLLIFTKDNFKTVFLAKVARNCRQRIVIEFVDEAPESFGLNTTFTMVECCAFFEPYFQVLTVLKDMAVEDFPMKRYIVQADASKNVDRPRYLKNISYEEQDQQDFVKGSSLNSAQAEAFKAALTQEFVVIQGPPGTGKTFLGLKIAEYLIKNHEAWYKNSPMLIISYKNHALDQFLEGLLPITDKLVRVGGQSKSELLKEYNLIEKRRGKRATTLTDLFSRLRIDDFSILKDALVVAMTTTGAARRKDTLKKLKCPIVIVEEAAEVLEAHVVAALTENCQHLILLGDHQQLKPNTSNHTIRTKYGLGISLFERMVNNGIQCYKLEVQHRMRPEISRLINPLIYSFLEDHESVKSRPSVSGVDGNVFFIDHQLPEDDTNSTSKKNTHEAKFVVALAKYLVLNCHNPHDIVILTTYAAQVEEIQNEIKKIELLSVVKVSTLDAFQGQEADIVLLSLVRSKKIGFLNAEDRICVALSRARNGLYIIGNMDLLKNNSMIWFRVKRRLLQTSSFGTELVLRCQSHPLTETRVKSAEDFENVPFGGCLLQCDFKLSCRHKCRYRCHVFDKKHEEYECKETCGKLIKCTENHRSVCEKMCYQECVCMENVFKEFECGHIKSTECWDECCPEGCSVQQE